MADTEFEQLIFLPPTTLFPKTAADPYTLVHDIDEDSSPSPDDGKRETSPERQDHSSCYSSPVRRHAGLARGVPDLHPDSADTVVRYESEFRSAPLWCPSPLSLTKHQSNNIGSGEVTSRRRRKLPEIPKIRKAVKQLSLADELGQTSTFEEMIGVPDFMIGGVTRPLSLHNPLPCHNSPQSDILQSTDADSGNSTAYSPDLLKSGSPIQDPGSFTPISASSSMDRMGQLELVDPTHRGLHRFVPRHRDEVEIDIGDPIYVKKEADDFWCEGINLRTGLHGIFPSAHIVDVDYSDFDPSQPKVRRERFILGYLGSVETLAHKGNSVLCQAVKKIRGKDYTPHSCILEVSDTGIRMVDRKKPVRREAGCHDYFYSLKNVSFCAFHPRDQRYMGFITKHPACDRFACHVFVGCESTRPVAEAVGRAFNRFYQKYVETAFPVEDIYIE